jgi:hypothetical protein
VMAWWRRTGGIWITLLVIVVLALVSVLYR